MSKGRRRRRKENDWRGDDREGRTSKGGCVGGIKKRERQSTCRL